MSEESYLLNHELFLNNVRRKKISHDTIAEYLSVSTKTVQRWVNKTSRRIKKQHVEMLSILLEVNRTDLFIESSVERIKASNKALEILLSEAYLQKQKCYTSWRELLKVLMSFDTSELSSTQEWKLKKTIGICFVNLGSLLAASKCFKKLSKHKCYEDSLNKSEVSYWQAYIKFYQGCIDQSFELIEQINLGQCTEAVKVKCLNLKSLIQYWKGDFQSSINTAKSALSYIRKNKIKTCDTVVLYEKLLLSYLSLEEYAKADASIRRMSLYAMAYEWNSKVFSSKGYLQLSKFITSEGKNKFSFFHPKIIQFNRDQVEFNRFAIVSNILNGNLENTILRYQALKHQCRFSPILKNSLLLDRLILDKIFKGYFVLDKDKIDALREFFLFRKVNHQLKILDYVQQKESLTNHEFFLLYFLNKVPA